MMGETIMTKNTDWLSRGTIWFIQLARLLIAFAALGIGFALVATIFGDTGRLDPLSDILGEGTEAYDGPIGLSILFGVSLVTLILIDRFLKVLKDVVQTVPEGDPFTQDNADRLKRLSLLALAMQTLGLVPKVFSDGLATVSHQAGLIIQPTPEGILFTLVLFILARVFGQGAAMREDLEGTI